MQHPQAPEYTVIIGETDVAALPAKDEESTRVPSLPDHLLQSLHTARAASPSALAASGPQMAAEGGEDSTETHRDFSSIRLRRCLSRARSIVKDYPHPHPDWCPCSHLGGASAASEPEQTGSGSGPSDCCIPCRSICGWTVFTSLLVLTAAGHLSLSISICPYVCVCVCIHTPHVCVCVYVCIEHILFCILFFCSFYFFLTTSVL